MSTSASVAQLSSAAMTPSWKESQMPMRRLMSVGLVLMLIMSVLMRLKRSACA